jgi:hypothetical protein
VRLDVANTLQELRTVLLFLLPWHWWRFGRQWWKHQREYRRFQQQEALGPPSLAEAARNVFQAGSWLRRWQQLRREMVAHDAAGTARGAFQWVVALLLLAGLCWAIVEAGGRQDPRLRSSRSGDRQEAGTHEAGNGSGR